MCASIIFVIDASYCQSTTISFSLDQCPGRLLEVSFWPGYRRPSYGSLGILDLSTPSLIYRSLVRSLISCSYCYSQLYSTACASQRQCTGTLPHPTCRFATVWPTGVPLLHSVYNLPISSSVLDGQDSSQHVCSISRCVAFALSTHSLRPHSQCINISHPGSRTSCN